MDTIRFIRLANWIDKYNFVRRRNNRAELSIMVREGREEVN